MADTWPSFPHYARDWFIATRSLSAAARGAHIDFMSVSWIQGSVPADPDELRRIAGMEKPEWRKVWPQIEAKWPLCDDGVRRNPRLEEVRAEAVAFSERKAMAGQKGGLAKSSKGVANGKQTGSTARAQLQQTPSTRGSKPLADAKPALALASAASSLRSDAERATFDAGESPTRKRLPHCAWEGRREGLSVPNFLHRELLSKMAQPDEAALLAWYPTVEAVYDGQDIGEDTREFWRARFKEWRGTTPATGKVAGLAGGGTRPYTPTTVEVHDPDYNGHPYRFRCEHTPPCTRWTQHRERHAREEARTA